MNALTERTVRFFLSEDIREEVHGKLTMVGMYPDGVVLLQIPADMPDPTPDAPAFLDRLATMYVVSGPPGKLEWSLELLEPSGKTVTHAEGGTLVQVAGRSLNLIGRSSPFVVHSLGEYTYVATLNGEVFKFPVTFRRELQSDRQRVNPESVPPGV